MEMWSGTAADCPGQWWNQHLWKCSEGLWMWHQRTWLSSEHSGSGLRVGLNDLKVFSYLNNPVIVNDSRIIWFPTCRSCNKQASALLSVRADPVEALSSAINI